MSRHWNWNGRRVLKNNSLRRAAFNLAALFVISLVTFAPLAPAFAQSVDTSATPSTEGAVSAAPSSDTQAVTGNASPSSDSGTGDDGSVLPQPASSDVAPSAVAQPTTEAQQPSGGADDTSAAVEPSPDLPGTAQSS